MFAKRTITTLVAGLALGLLLASTPAANAQVITEGCGCLQPSCGTCNACECGQASCVTCQAQPVQACGCGVRSCRGGCRLARRIPCNRCPNCDNEVCMPETNLEKEKRSCWKTEQKVICIPKIQFPWQKCNGPQCGKTKTITILKRHDFECEVCKTTWKLVEPKLPETQAPAPAPTTQALPPIVPAVQAMEPIEQLPPAPPATTNTLQFESKFIPAKTPLIIQRNANPGR